MFHFGSGTLFGTPVGGNLATNPTPQRFGTLQDVSIEIAGNLKELYGQNQFPDRVVRGKVKITGKAKYGNIFGKQFNDLYFGQTLNPANKMELVALNETATIPGTPFQITVINGATFYKDLGVFYAATGLPLTQVPSAPATGQYSVNTATGIYTFAAADTGLSVQINYSYQSAAAVGVTAHITNQLMAFQPIFQVFLSQQLANPAGTVLQSNILLYACVGAKLTWATKNEDYTIPDFEFAAFADSGGNVIDFYEQQ